MMRNIVLVGLLLSVIPVPVFAGAAPEIGFSKLEHDFGDIIHGNSPSVEIPFTNTGDEMLIVEKIESSCGCAKAVRGSRKVASGETSMIFAQISTYGMTPGRHIQNVDVHTNDPKHPITRLRLSFNVVRHVSIAPEFLATRIADTNRDAVFRLNATNHWTQPITLQAPSSKGAAEVLLVPEEVVVQPGGKAEFELTLRVDRTTDQPYAKGTTFIRTNDPLERMLRLRYFIAFLKPGRE